jgi:hypothetical protein
VIKQSVGRHTLLSLAKIAHLTKKVIVPALQALCPGPDPSCIALRVGKIDVFRQLSKELFEKHINIYSEHLHTV